MKLRIQTTLNGEPTEFLTEPQRTLLEALRERYPDTAVIMLTGFGDRLKSWKR